MRARDRDVLGAEFGLGHALVGIGPGRSEKAERMLMRFAELPEGTFVWTQTAADRCFHLGRITGPLRRDESPEARRVGLQDVRPTQWLPRAFAPDEVPVAVAATFARGGRNLQRTHDREAERRTEELWREG